MTPVCTVSESVLDQLAWNLKSVWPHVTDVEWMQVFEAESQRDLHSSNRVTDQSLF